MSEEMSVDRCDCIGCSFVQLLAFDSLEATMAETDAGRDCEGCLPYLKLAFATGETVLAVDDPRLAAYE